MFYINAINEPPGYGRAIYGGYGADVGSRYLGDRLGPQGAVYFVSVPGLGTLSLEDVGLLSNGNYGVRVNGGPIWEYRGGGQGSIDIGIDGKVALYGDISTVNTVLVTEMLDVGPISQLMVIMAQRSPALTASWNANAMQTLYAMGYPRTCMYNMDSECCRQVEAFMQSIVLSTQAHEAVDIDLYLSQELGLWWTCILCQARYFATIAVVFVPVISILTLFGVTEATVALLAELQVVIIAAAALDLAAWDLAATIAAVFSLTGIFCFIEYSVSKICVQKGRCPAHAIPGPGHSGVLV
jgi:hypothetical protein